MNTARTRQIASCRRILVTVGLALAGTALMLIPALLIASGETATHAKLHIISAAVVMTATAAVALGWRNTRRRSEWIARRALLASLSALALAQLVESVGALAWGPDGETLTSPALQVIHTAAALTGAAALFAVGASAIAALVTLMLRLTPARTGGLRNAAARRRLRHRGDLRGCEQHRLRQVEPDLGRPARRQQR